MKHWWQSVVKDYFTFSKRERIGIIIMLGLGFTFYFFPRLHTTKEAPLDTTAFEEDIAGLKIYKDSSRLYANNGNENDAFDYYRPRRYVFDDNLKGELFFFDPNTLDAAGWKKLGLRDRTIQTVQKLISKGFRFREAEDLKKIYGLRSIEAERLLPFVSIPEAIVSGNNQVNNASKYLPAQPNRIQAIEINTADSSAFINLPGIGSKLATRIINFREKLGGFASVGQVGETYGLPDSTFQVVKNKLLCNSNAIRKLNINTADVNELKTHPYIKWNLANAIVNFRKQHGLFKSLADLKKIDVVDDAMFEKLAPYLTT